MLLRENIKYLMRVSKAFLKVVVNAPAADQIIESKYKNKLLKMRVLKFKLESGDTEILITNLFDKAEETFTIHDFKELYFKRWGIEVKYNELKSRLQIENFTGKTPISIEQDFYATIYLANMVALAKKDANIIIEERNIDKNLKHEYKVNTNILIGKLKDNLILMHLEKKSRKRKKMLKEITDEIVRNTIPIRQNRKYERRMTLRANKNVLNTKRGI